MFYYKKGNTEICVNLNEGFVESLKFKGKEYIGAKVPLFLLALRNEIGKRPEGENSPVISLAIAKPPTAPGNQA